MTPALSKHRWTTTQTWPTGKNFDEEVARQIRELEELQYGKGKGPAKDADGET